MQLTAEQWQTQRWEREVEQRNRALSDEELDSMMPTEGYKVLEQPPGYAPIRTPARKLMATPTPLGGTPMYQIPEEDHQQKFDVPIEMEGLPEMKPEDQQYFGKLLKVPFQPMLLIVLLQAMFLHIFVICLHYFLIVTMYSFAFLNCSKEVHLNTCVMRFRDCSHNSTVSFRLQLQRWQDAITDRLPVNRLPSSVCIQYQECSCYIRHASHPSMVPLHGFQRSFTIFRLWIALNNWRDMQDVDDQELSAEEAKERKIMKLLLKVKNGTPPQRKSALRQLTDKARDFGAGPLFNQILPLLMAPTLEDQERHLLVKVIDRILYKLDELVRPFVHKILVVIEPLLIDEDYYARVEGREIIANLSKAAGLATMIASMRPDIDNIDEYVRNTTARAFSVVASALGIPALLPFLKAVCMSKKSWQARHTGIKIVQQIAILLGCAVLPHLKVCANVGILCPLESFPILLLLLLFHLQYLSTGLWHTTVTVTFCCRSVIACSALLYHVVCPLLHPSTSTSVA